MHAILKLNSFKWISSLLFFFNRDIKEEVYVAQLKGFEDSQYTNYVLILNKEPHGLRQDPRAWYDKITSFLL